MNPDLQRLHPYPFERIRALLRDHPAPASTRIALSIGEPKHEAPEFVLPTLMDNWRELESYPTTRGSDALRESIADWLCTRYNLSTSSVQVNRHILPVNGTREALFAIAHCLLNRDGAKRTALSPNPFYQIYEGAILLAGLTPTFYNLATENSTRPLYWEDDDPRWADVQLMYICNPGNPTGNVLPLDTLKALVELAAKHRFVVVSDECYSEIYRNEAEPPVGLLQAAAAAGNDQFDRCLVFHSLSKRSNLPGLRSGFIAGDSELIKKFLLYRTYHGCAMAPPTQAVSIAAWRDEEHVIANRVLYDEKYAAVVPILSDVLPIQKPEAGFYLWPDLGIDDEKFTCDMHRLHNISVVPGSYLSRQVDGYNPGSQHTRLALVAPLAECIEAAEKIRYYFQHQCAH